MTAILAHRMTWADAAFIVVAYITVVAIVVWRAVRSK